MSSSERNGMAKEKRRIFDETGKRLMREIQPLGGWVLLSAVLCLVLIGCAVAIPELMGALMHIGAAVASIRYASFVLCIPCFSASGNITLPTVRQLK